MKWTHVFRIWLVRLGHPVWVCKLTDIVTSLCSVFAMCIYLEWIGNKQKCDNANKLLTFINYNQEDGVSNIRNKSSNIKNSSKSQNFNNITLINLIFSNLTYYLMCQLIVFTYDMIFSNQKLFDVSIGTCHSWLDFFWCRPSQEWQVSIDTSRSFRKKL